jgi:hypothetical protein
MLLLKHFRAYLQFPPLPTSYFPEPENPRSQQQVLFSEAYSRRLVHVQANSRYSRGVHLTFRPLGKNLRLLSSAIRANADRNLRTVIEASGPANEIHDLRAKGYEWSPWLWCRSGNATAQSATAESDAGEGWSTLFRRPDSNPTMLESKPLTMPTLGAAEPPFGRRHLERVLKVAAAASYIFDPVDSIKLQLSEQKQKMGWPGQGERILGMHVRRGDAAVSRGETYTDKNSTRTSFALESYLQAADRLCAKYDIRHIFLATESADEIHRARAMRPQYVFMCLTHDRSIFPDLASSPQFIEEMTFEHPERARPLAISAILDLHFFSACHAFIGTFNSEFSLLAWLLAIGQRRHLIPYISLSVPAKSRSLHPLDALLNLRNNCPLELYHW